MGRAMALMIGVYIAVSVLCGALFGAGVVLLVHWLF